MQNERASVKDLVLQLNAELQIEQESTLSEEERKLTDIARKMLVLERDLNLIGAQVSQSSRVERLRDLIEKEDF